MSEHSIEELERQWRAANDRMTKAVTDEREAKKRLTEAKLDATGLRGHRVSYVRGTERREFVAMSFSRWSDKILRGPKIKKDGKFSSFDDDAEISRLTDHGPYVEPTP